MRILDDSRPGPAPDTEPIDLRLMRRSLPPAPGAMHEPFAQGRRPAVPRAGNGTVRLLGAPIPDRHVADPAPGRRDPRVSLVGVRRTVTGRWHRRWSPRRRRRLARTAIVAASAVSLVLVLLAALSVVLG